MKSGKCLKELRGHNSYVTDVKYTEDCHQCVSGCADGTVKVAEQDYVLQKHSVCAGVEPEVHGVRQHFPSTAGSARDECAFVAQVQRSIPHLQPEQHHLCLQFARTGLHFCCQICNF